MSEKMWAGKRKQMNIRVDSWKNYRNQTPSRIYWKYQPFQFFNQI